MYRYILLFVLVNDLHRELDRYGKIQDVWIARNPPGFAFVEYSDSRDARDAVREMDGRTIMSNRIRCEISRRPGARSGPMGAAAVAIPEIGGVMTTGIATAKDLVIAAAETTIAVEVATTTGVAMEETAMMTVEILEEIVIAVILVGTAIGTSVGIGILAGTSVGIGIMAETQAATATMVGANLGNVLSAHL